MLFLYIPFYIITGILIFLYLFNEKKVIEVIDNLAKKAANIIKIPEKNFLKYLRYITFTLIMCILTFYTFRLDFKTSEILPLKNKGMYIIVVLNYILLLALLVKKIYLGFLFVLNLAYLVFAKAMLGIDDTNMFIMLFLINIFMFVLIILIQEELSKSLKTIFNGSYLILLVIIIQNFYLGNYYIPTGSMEPTIMVGDRIFSNNMIYKFRKPKIGDIVSFKEPLDNSLMYTKRIVAASNDNLNISLIDNNIYINGEKSSLNREYTIEGILKLFNNPSIYIPSKNDSVKISYLIEFDISNFENPIRLISLKDFEKLNIDKKHYKNIFGIWNSKTLDQIEGISQDLKNKRYTYILTLTNDESKFILPILDFKYNEKEMSKLLKGESVIVKDNYYMAMGDNTRNSNDSRFFGYVKESRIYGKLLLRWYPFNRFGILK